MRAPNEIDFWRGFALVTIFINHIPGIYFERFSFRNVSLSDSAELFVFLAGWAMRKLIEGPARALPAKWLILRLETRAFQVYVAQMVVTELAISLLAAASICLDAPFLLDWHNASGVFNDPIKAHIGLVLLTHQLGYFNILPLYVVLIFIAPAVALLHRHAPALLLLASVAIYAAALVFGVNLPTWPVEGTWFLNPLAWQLIYVLGFLLAGEDGIGGFARRHRSILRWLALPVVVLGVAVGMADFSPDPVDLPEPKLLFTFDKTFLSPARLIHSLALTAIFAGSFKIIDRWIPRLPASPPSTASISRPCAVVVSAHVRHRLPLRQGFGVKNTFQALGDVLLDRNQIGKSCMQSGRALCAAKRGRHCQKRFRPRSSEECRLKKECYENVNYVFFVHSNACRRVSSAIGMRSRF
jgi:hypothetical protein